MKKYSNILPKTNTILAAGLIAFFIPILVALAQTDGSGTAPSPVGSSPSSSVTPSNSVIYTAPRPTQSASSPSQTNTAPTLAQPQETNSSGLQTISPVQGNQSNLPVILVAISALLAATAGIYGLFLLRIKKKTSQNSSQENKCDTIKHLLEQKKRELEDMAREWPEEKIKAMMKEKLLNELKKDESMGKLIHAAENAKQKYDRLKKTVDMLSQRYDLCTISVALPDKKLHGIIVEGSLTDKEILKTLKVIKDYPYGNWLANRVAVSKKEIEKLPEFLHDGPWYMYFWENNHSGIVAFKNKQFNIDPSKKESWNKAIEYGVSQGIAQNQLDFTIQE